VDTISKVKLDPDEILVSFDVVSLYTNVPVKESIQVCADLLFNKHKIGLPVDKETFIELAMIASCDVIMLTPEGYYRQVDGLAMGSPCAPLLANGWLSKYDNQIKDNAKIFVRYMDDIMRDIKRIAYDNKLKEINNLHDKLSFTGEKECEGKLPFLDAKMLNNEGVLSSTWFCKPSDTGLIMNFHALAPMKYKRAVVIGFVHRIFRACSNWNNFHESIERAKTILLKNQYPPRFSDSIIQDTITKLVLKENKCKDDDKLDADPFLLFVQYRGKCSEKYASEIKKTGVQVKIIFTLRKLKTVTPSLKPPIEKALTLRSKVVYQFTCSRCEACYVGATSRHLQTRHIKRKYGVVYKHLARCGVNGHESDMDILCATQKGEVHLFTLEALIIRQVKPQINVRDEFKSRELIIKF